MMRCMRRRLLGVLACGAAIVVTGLGSATYDVFAAGDHDGNFYLWGEMGGAAIRRISPRSNSDMARSYHPYGAGATGSPRRLSA